MDTILEILKAGAEGNEALAGPVRAPLTYGGLPAQVARIRAALAGLGIGAGDRLAIVQPNGPEAASSFLGVTAGAVAAPMCSRATKIMLMPTRPRLLTAGSAPVIKG